MGKRKYLGRAVAIIDRALLLFLQISVDSSVVTTDAAPTLAASSGASDSLLSRGAVAGIVSAGVVVLALLVVVLVLRCLRQSKAKVFASEEGQKGDPLPSLADLHGPSPVPNETVSSAMVQTQRRPMKPERVGLDPEAADVDTPVIRVYADE